MPCPRLQRRRRQRPARISSPSNPAVYRHILLPSMCRPPAVLHPLPLRFVLSRYCYCHLTAMIDHQTRNRPHCKPAEGAGRRPAAGCATATWQLHSNSLIWNDDGWSWICAVSDSLAQLSLTAQIQDHPELVTVTHALMPMLTRMHPVFFLLCVPVCG